MNTKVDEITIRGATLEDGRAMSRLVRESGVLEENTPYAYLLLATHFGETCVIAEMNDEPVGFVAAYRPPVKPDVVFVWQVGVSPKARRRGLALRMLDELVRRPGCEGVRYLEATVTPDNAASRRLFRSFGERRSAPVSIGKGFSSEDFGGTDHEPEELFRIGPIERQK